MATTWREGSVAMTSGACKLVPVMTVDVALLRPLARVMIAAWGTKPSKSQVEQRATQLARDLRTLLPSRICLLAAIRSGRVTGVGRADQDRTDPSQWWFTGVVVDPRHRRQGIARMLGEARIVHARRCGARVIRSATNVDNDVSIRYHLRLGFICDGPFTAPDGETKVAFHLDLEHPQSLVQP